MSFLPFFQLAQGATVLNQALLLQCLPFPESSADELVAIGYGEVADIRLCEGEPAVAELLGGLPHVELHVRGVELAQ